MPTDPKHARIRAVNTMLSLGFAGAAVLGAPRPVAADRTHVVRPGQSLGIIAQRYGRSAAELAAANGLDKDGILQQGQVLKVPPKGVLYVATGQTLSQIAEAHHLTTQALAQANHIHPDSILQIGQKLVLPGTKPKARSSQARANSRRSSAPPHQRAEQQSRPDDGQRQAKAIHAAKPAETKSGSVVRHMVHNSGDPAEPPKRAKRDSDLGKGKRKPSGVVSLFRLWSRESVRMRLVDSRGRARPAAMRALRELLRPRDSRRRKMPNARLLALLTRVSDHFGGRTIHVVSGYRLPRGLTRKTSRHVAGQAIDFRIPGVPLTALRDYCTRLSDVGVGYYPITQFVHLDVRKQAARWTDWSLPGQPPVLTKPAEYEEGGDDNAPLRTGEAAAQASPLSDDRRPSDGPAG